MAESMEAQPPDPSDLELVRLARGGDSSALERLFERHYRTAYRFAYRWCGSRPDAEDAAQEAFVKVARGLKAFREASSFTTWLYRVVVNAAMDQRRRAAARARLAQEVRREGRPEAAAPAADCGVEEAWEAICRLPEKQRAALLLVFGEGLSHREAAGVLGCPEISVSWRIHQARRRLGRIMERVR